MYTNDILIHMERQHASRPLRRDLPYLERQLRLRKAEKAWLAGQITDREMRWAQSQYEEDWVQVSHDAEERIRLKIETGKEN